MSSAFWSPRLEKNIDFALVPVEHLQAGPVQPRLDRARGDVERRGGESTFRSDQQNLQQAAMSAREAENAAARMALAEFYFAHGLIEEAKGALAQIGREGRSQLDQRELALLTGAIQTLKFMGEKGCLMSLRTAEGETGELARRAFHELMNPALVEAEKLDHLDPKAAKKGE